MLSAIEIADAIDLANGGGSEGLFISPAPDVADLRVRGQTSVDLRLGRWFLSFKQTRTSSISLVGDGEENPISRTREHFVPFDSFYVLHPGSFILGVTLEWLGLPSHISGYITGKSRLGRHGLTIETASGIHPHFSGCLTLELANIGEVPLTIHPGMSICQVFFHRVSRRIISSEVTERAFLSGRRRPVLSKPQADDVFMRLRRNAQRAATRRQLSGQ